MLSVILYLAVFAASGLMASCTIQQKFNKKVIHNEGVQRQFLLSGREGGKWGIAKLLIKALFCSLPVILLYGLRVGIGTDYTAYEGMYEVLHNADFFYYWEKHNEIAGAFYVEPGYYILNKLAPSYRILLFADILFIIIPLWLALFEFKEKISFSFAIFIFMSIQFIYSMNGVRYIIAVSFILLGFVYLISGRNLRFFCCILTASLFHTSALICTAYYFIKNLKNNRLNAVRNMLFYAAVFMFAFGSKYIIRLVSGIPVFYRYFSTEVYSFSDGMQHGVFWLLHIIPVIVPLLLVCGKNLLYDSRSGIMFRIYLTEIPFRMMGLYNTWFTRLVRIPQVIEVIFIPYVLKNIKNKNTRRIMILYYAVWYVFYFVYYILVNDQRSSIPYQWIFSRH